MRQLFGIRQMMVYHHNHGTLVFCRICEVKRPDAHVKFQNVANKMTMEYTIVGETEADFAHGKLAATTPIAKALMGHKVGEIVDAQVPQGIIKFKILDISL